MKKLDKGDKMIIASVILAIGIAISAYFIANPKHELEQCVDSYMEIDPNASLFMARGNCIDIISN